MTKSLPVRPSLENLKKQAKSLLKSHQSADPAACGPLRRLHRFSRMSDEGILASKLTLAEAQYAVAMDYGFASWSALKESVEGRSDEMRFLHLHWGDSSAESLRRSGVPGKVRVWYDALCEGPTPEGVTNEEWLALRAGTFADRFDSPESGIRFFREMYVQMEEFRAFEEVVLWFDACLFDQTILIHHLDWFSRRDLVRTRLSLICVGEFPGMPRFAGLGELRPEQMASLLGTRHKVTAQELDLAREAWRAYRSPDPTAVETLLNRNTSALPYLAPAFKRHLQRFPSIHNGLNRQEQKSLESISQGHTVFADLFFRVSEAEDVPYLGDTMLLVQLEALTQGLHPLLRMEGTEFTQGLRHHEWPARKISFHLTDAGRQVLAGNADYVQLNGIDRWLGGVHLQGPESQWRWNEATGKLVRM